MPTPGLALIGFLDEPEAIGFLMNRCMPANPDPAALSAEWQAAKNNLGPPDPKAGMPEILDMPASVGGKLQLVVQTPRFGELTQNLTWSFKLVEIDPILAYQHQVDTSRSASLCDALGSNPSIEKLIDVCLPPVLEDIQHQIVGQANSVIVRAKSLNLRMLRGGMLGADPNYGASFAGIGFGPGLSLIQVARFDGKCYLRNGYHRTYGIRRAGATHVPCVLLDMQSFNETGAVGPPATFSETLLRSNNPPTCGHFAQGKAHPVQLRAVSRIIQVTWTECVLPDE